VRDGEVCVFAQTHSHYRETHLFVTVCMCAYLSVSMLWVGVNACLPVCLHVCCTWIGLGPAGAAVFTNPFDVAKVRMQLQGEAQSGGEKAYKVRVLCVCMCVCAN